MLEEYVPFILLVIVVLSLRSDPSIRNWVTASLGALAVWIATPKTSGWGDFVLFALVVLAFVLSPLQRLLFKGDAKYNSESPINILHDPPDADSDIVAVHGLGSSVETTWQHGHSGRLWLKDDLPLDLPKSRIMTYQHHSRWMSHAQAKNLSDFGKQLLSALDGVRNADETRRRPLLFVGHSFGGLLIEQALVIAKSGSSDKNVQERRTNLANSLSGIIFLGTPHAGSSYSAIGKLICHLMYWQGSSTVLLNSIDPASDATRELEDAFCSNYAGLPTMDFHESYPNTLLGFRVNLIVNKKSATRPGHNSEPLDADHFGLNKYLNREDKNFIRVRSEIARMIDQKIRDDEGNLDAEREKYHELFSWLQPYSFEAVQKSYRQQFIDGTCRWITEEKTFQEWGQGKDVLWLFGKPGSGKTFIAHHLYEYLQGQHETTMHFFFDAKSNTKHLRSLEKFYQTILYQLFYQLPFSARRLRAKCFDIVRQKRLRGPMDENTLKDAIRQILGEMGRPSFLIIDALDECNETPSDPADLQEWLAEQNLHPQLRTLITSRPEQRVREVANHSLFLHLELASLVNKSNNDIKLLIQKRFEVSKRFISSDPEWTALKAKIQEKLLERADGMILYPKLMLDILEKKPGDTEDLMAELEKLPDNIISIYARRLEEIHDVEFASTIFQWLVTCRRPLTVACLLGVYTVVKKMKNNGDFALRGQDLKHRMDQEHFRWFLEEECFPLIEILDNDIIRLTHTSISQFLLGQHIEGLSGNFRSMETSKVPRAPEGFRFRIEESHEQLAMTCLAYLRLVIELQSGNGISTNLNLREYAVIECTGHSQECEKEWEREMESAPTKIVDVLVSFCKEPTLFNAWLNERASQDARFAIQFSIKDSACSRYPTQLHVAAYFSLWRVGREFLNDANVSDATGSTPLHIAAEQGHLPTVRGLLDAGARIDMQDSTGSTAVHRATRRGKAAALKELIIGRNVDLDATDKYNFTPLHIACHLGKADCVQILLDHGAKINNWTEQPPIETPLGLAIANGHFQAVRIILNHRPQLIELCGMPLIHASRKGKTHMVKFLWEHRANISYVDLHGQTVLHKACISGNTDLVRFLLSDLKVAVDCSDKSDRTPLYFAAEKGYLDIVNLLISSGANVNSLDRRRETALFKPAGRGHTMIVERLLEAGTDATILDAWQRAPLQFATMYGRTDVVRILLENTKIDLNALDWSSQSTLHYAAGWLRKGQEEVVDLLFAHGAIPEQRGRFDGSALHTAILRVPGQPPPTRILLEKLVQYGVPLDSKDKYHRSPLYAATQARNIEAMEVLLQAGANPGNNALHVAVGSGLISIVRPLLNFKSRLDLSERNWRGETALHVAARGGHNDIVSELLQTDIPTRALDMDDMTALMRAVKRKHPSTVSLLQGVEAIPTEDYQGQDAHSLWGTSVLHWAAEDGANLEKYLLDTSRINSKDDVGRTALHLAVKSENLVAVQQLISATADIELADESDRTPLHYAVQTGNLDTLEALISAGADLNACDRWLRSPLHLAVLRGDLATTRHLVSAAARILRDFRGQTVLHIAAINGREDIISTLLHNGTTEDIVFQKDHEERTALHLASEHGHAEIAKKILQRFDQTPIVNIQDERGTTPLHLAAEKGHHSVIRFLLEAGAIVYRANRNRDMAIHFAAEAGYLEIVKILLDAIPGQVERYLEKWYQSPRRWRIIAQKDAQWDWAILEVLSNIGAFRNASQWSPENREALESSVVSELEIWDKEAHSIPSTTLMRAVEGGSVDTVKFLLDRVPDMPLHTSSYSAINVLSLACSQGFKEIASLLINAGSNVNAITDKQETALLEAARNGHADVVELLLENSANADMARLEDGYTPLHCAAEKGFVEVVQALVHKAFVNVLDDSGQTPLHLACHSGNEMVVEVLLRADADVLIQDAQDRTPLNVAGDLKSSNILSRLEEEAKKQRLQRGA